MPRCAPLYSNATGERLPRTHVSLSESSLFLTFPDGRWHDVALHGCRFRVRDATYRQRFVRHLMIYRGRHEPSTGQVDLITPPDEGSIAPRAVRLPGVSEGAAVIETAVWEALADWLSRGGRVAGRTIAELARLSCIATPQFAVTLGAVAARVAAELNWEKCGPMRGSGGIHNPLRPLEDAARRSPRAADALRAAMTARATQRYRRRSC
ncbi:MAG: hypothetical protein MJE77_46630 [Proteobacteria bacterium]|nr:hypothetical protein [Pseudomonadota bacterium]